MCQTKSISELYNAIVSIIDDDDKKHTYSSKAYTRVSQKYSIEHVWNSLANIWKF